MANYKVVIGLETHVQLKTKTKLFCGCSTLFGKSPNSSTCPVCLGLPGSLPVLNKKALAYTIKTALALNCQIASFSKFARKNYFYPDLPKNFQVSQYDEPLSQHGYLDIYLDDKLYKIGITRIHLEEDAGKLIHLDDDINKAKSSFVDFNRTGTPLMEIVTDPDIHSSSEAYEYLSSLKKILEYIEVSDCNMDEGSLRCDANISIEVDGKTGTKVEIKNLNSFKNVEKALNYEIKHQIEMIEKGEKIIHGTKSWDESLQKTLEMRSKEKAHDYRYFPEPDLMPIVIDKNWLEEIKKTIVELPLAKEKRLIEQYKLDFASSEILVSDKFLADYFEKCTDFYSNYKNIANWITGEVLSCLKENNLLIKNFPVEPKHLTDLLVFIDEKIINRNTAKEIFVEMFKTKKTAQEIIEKKGLAQISDEKFLLEVIDEIIAENKDVVEKIKNGKSQSIGFLVGQIMKKTKGKANPHMINELLKQKL